MILMDYFCTILQVEGGAFWFALEQHTFFILRTFSQIMISQLP